MAIEDGEGDAKADQTSMTRETNSTEKTRSEAPNKEEDHRTNRDMDADYDRDATQRPWAMQNGRTRDKHQMTVGTNDGPDAQPEYGDDAGKTVTKNDDGRTMPEKKKTKSVG